MESLQSCYQFCFTFYLAGFRLKSFFKGDSWNCLNALPADFYKWMVSWLGTIFLGSHLFPFQSVLAHCSLISGTAASEKRFTKVLLCLLLCWNDMPFFSEYLEKYQKFFQLFQVYKHSKSLDSNIILTWSSVVNSSQKLCLSLNDILLHIFHSLLHAVFSLLDFAGPPLSSYSLFLNFLLCFFTFCDRSQAL